MAANNPLWTWDATLHIRLEHLILQPEDLKGRTGMDCIIENIKKWLRTYCKAWAFQIEKGEEKGALHAQCRFSLRAKRRLQEVVGIAKGTIMQGAHFSRTSKGGKRSFDYAMKEETRQFGPWTDKDPPPEELPLELVGGKLRVWQQEVINNIREDDLKNRTVNVLIDLAGGAGKGYLRKYLEHYKIAKTMPHVTEAKHMAAWALKFPHQAYVLDVPRDRTVAGKQKKHVNTELWAGIEMLKDGRAVELRYTPQDRQLTHNPVIWVFTNDIPEPSVLSRDRWRLWVVDPKKEALLECDWDNIATRAGHIAKYNDEQREKRMKAKRALEPSEWDMEHTDKKARIGNHF